MKHLIILLNLFCSCLVLGQTKISTPSDFTGIYAGKLIIANANGSQEIDMEFHLLPTDTIGKYQYTIIYNKQARNYSLIEKDKEKGLYAIDENNGIVLEAYFTNNTLYSIFEVQGNLITTTEHFQEAFMDFEIMFSNTTKKVKSGNGTEESPEVTSYPVLGVQKARLYKQ